METNRAIITTIKETKIIFTVVDWLPLTSYRWPWIITHKDRCLGRARNWRLINVWSKNCRCRNIRISVFIFCHHQLFVSQHIARGLFNRHNTSNRTIHGTPAPQPRINSFYWNNFLTINSFSDCRKNLITIRNSITNTSSTDRVIITTIIITSIKNPIFTTILFFTININISNLTNTSTSSKFPTKFIS